MRVDFAGLRKVDEALAAIPASMRRPVVLAALRKGSKPYVDAARAAAPRGDDPSKRGSAKMRRSGKSKTIGAAADSIKARALPASQSRLVTVSVGPSAQHFYLRFAEFGTARIPGRRFLTRAYEATKLEVADRTAAQLWLQVEATVRRLSSQAASGSLGGGARSALAGGR